MPDGRKRIREPSGSSKLLTDAAACERAAVYAYRAGDIARHEQLKRRADELRREALGRREKG